MRVNKGQVEETHKEQVNVGGAGGLTDRAD